MACTASWAEGREDGLSNELSEKACPRCTFLNDKSAGNCGACGLVLKHANIAPDAEIIDLSSDDDEEIQCKMCTLLNKSGTLVCVACAAPLNANGKEYMIDFFSASSSHVHMDSTGANLFFVEQMDAYDKEHAMGCSGASSSHVFMDSTGAKFACKTCTFLNKMSASNCVCCGAGLELRGLMDEDQLDIHARQADYESPENDFIVCQVCTGKFGSNSSGRKLTNCNHGFCRPCLTTLVVERLLDVMQSEETVQLFSKYDYAMRCPVEGCGHTLSRGDLRLVVGPSIQGMLDEWLMTSIRDQVVCPLTRHCPNCKDTDQQLLVAPNQFHLLQRSLLRKALKCNGLNLPPKRHLSKSMLVQHLKNAAPFSLLCSSCFFLVCQNCGLNPACVGGMVHACDPVRRQCFENTRSIMKLCFAYIQATLVCEKRRNTKKARTRVGFFFSNNIESNQPTQIHDGNGLFFKSLVKWFSNEDFEDMSKVQGTAAHGQTSEDEGSNPEKSKASLVDKLAQTALQELTSSISQILNENKGSLSPLFVALLCAHDLPYTLLKWLVRNDSFVDITARGDLYWTVLGFMRAVSSTWDLLPLLCSREAKHDCCATQCRWETPGSVMSEFEKLFKQAQFMLRRGEHLLLRDIQVNNGPEEERQKQLEHGRLLLSSLVADVVSTYELLHQRVSEWEKRTLPHHWSANHEGSNEVLRVMAKDEQDKGQSLCAQLKELLGKRIVHASSSPTSLREVRTHSLQADEELDFFELAELSCAGEDEGEATKNEDATTAPSAALVEAYKKALRPLQFNEVCLLPTHYFRHNVAKSEALMLNKRRARAISEEMTQLNTILPLEWDSSIFLRMDEQRPDVLRALIIGPQGTPYENGVFLFDLLLEESYPDTPPKVQFLTTGGGTVRFNPNLYNNGKVCLSLLGTWTGPGWKAGQSSILQVLVSIQGLILVTDPYFNEPGSEGWGNRRDADAYLHDQRLNTVRFSMLPALRFPDPLFVPVIHTHFRLKAPYILHQCNAWLQEESLSYSANEFKVLIDDLSSELIKLARF